MSCPGDEDAVARALEALPGLEERAAHLVAGLGWVRGLDVPPPPGEPETPDYYLYGVLGAKNVGKSSLVAALLGVEHRAEEDRELGEGTRRPRLYAAPELVEKVRTSFARAGVETDLAPSAGRAAQFSRIAFVDLPDIESRFSEHFETVLRIEDRILGLLVVRTAESSFDESFLERLGRFRRDDRDLYFVMNKFDQWVADFGGSEGEARAAASDHLAEVLRRLDLPTERVYPTDARPAALREKGGFDLGRLAKDLLSDKSTSELGRAKLRNWVHRLAAWVLALRGELDLEAGRRHLNAILGRSAAVVERLQKEGGSGDPVRELVPPALVDGFHRFLERTLEGSAESDRAESRLVRRVFARRVDGLPFVRLLAVPLFVAGDLADGLFSRLPRLVGARPALPGSDAVEAREALVAVVGAVEDRFALDRSALGRLYKGVPETGLWDEDAATRLLGTVLEDGARRREERVAARVVAPGVVYRLAVLAPLLWFALARPIAKAWVLAGRSFSPVSVMPVVPEVLLELTAPGYLLYGAACLVLLYGLVLAAEYRHAKTLVASGDDEIEARRARVAELARDFWLEVFDRVVPQGFRRLESEVREAETRTGELLAGLEALEPEAVAHAREEAARVTPGRKVGKRSSGWKEASAAG